MAITRDQAMTENVFHENAQRTDGTCYAHRRNGKTQTWKTRTDDFRTPIVYGLRGYGQLTPANADQFHTEADCPMRTREAQPKRSRASR